MTTEIPLISLYQGESRTITPTVNTAEGTPDTITSYVFVWRMWHVLTGTVLEKTIGSGIEISDIDTGQLTITIEPIDTQDLASWTYKHQLVMEYGDMQQTVMEGLIQISMLLPEVPV